MEEPSCTRVRSATSRALMATNAVRYRTDAVAQARGDDSESRVAHQHREQHRRQEEEEDLDCTDCTVFNKDVFNVTALFVTEGALRRSTHSSRDPPADRAPAPPHLCSTCRRAAGSVSKGPASMASIGRTYVREGGLIGLAVFVLEGRAQRRSVDFEQNNSFVALKKSI